MTSTISGGTDENLYALPILVLIRTKPRRAELSLLVHGLTVCPTRFSLAEILVMAGTGGGMAPAAELHRSLYYDLCLAETCWGHSSPVTVMHRWSRKQQPARELRRAPSRSTLKLWSGVHCTSRRCYASTLIERRVRSFMLFLLLRCNKWIVPSRFR